MSDSDICNVCHHDWSKHVSDIEHADLEAENQRLREALGELFCGLDEHWVTYPENIPAIRKARELLENK